jgi:hypothetical protein
MYGTKENVWMKDADGKPVAVDTITKFSDTLLIFFLKANNPAKYRDNHAIQLTGANEGPVQVGMDPAFEAALAKAYGSAAVAAIGSTTVLPTTEGQ